MTKIINLTPHPINIIGIGEIQPEGKPVRMTESTISVGFVEIQTHNDEDSTVWVKIPIIKKQLGEIIGLPDPQSDTVYVVSLPVAQAARRTDVLAIGETIRDDKGNVVGAKSLAVLI